MLVSFLTSTHLAISINKFNNLQEYKDMIAINQTL